MVYTRAGLTIVRKRRRWNIEKDKKKECIGICMGQYKFGTNGWKENKDVTGLRNKDPYTGTSLCLCGLRRRDWKRVI